MVYDKYNDHSNVMNEFFKGRIKMNDIPKPKKVELGHGKGIGHSYGTYSQYIKKLREQTPKGNGIISIGKSVIEKDNIFSVPSTTDKFTVGDVPHVLIMYRNTINPMMIHVLWKDSEDEIISEQYYEISAAHSLNYDWWDQYGIYFVGPEDLEEGNYKVDIISTEFGVKDKIKTLGARIKFSLIEKEND